MTLDLGFTLVSTFAIFFLGTLVYFHDRKSATNIIFFYISLATVFWALANYWSLTAGPEHILIAIRLVLFFAAPHAVLFLIFVYNFPNSSIVIKKKYFVTAAFLTVVAMIAAVSPFVFTQVQYLENQPIPQPGFLIPLFGIIVVGSLALGLYQSFKKYTGASGELKKRWGAVLFGTASSYTLLILTQFIAVSVFKNVSLIIFAPLLMFPTFMGMAYAMIRYKLLKAKAIVVELLTFALLSLTLIEIFLSRTPEETILRSFIFSIFFIISMFLIKGVIQEVSLREQLQEANKAQENLLHFITHQIKGFLTKSKYIFAELLEGSFGSVNSEVKKMAEEGLKINTDGVNTVQTILNAANIKTGKVAYEMRPVDLKELIQKIFEKHRKDAQDKGLSYNLEIASNVDYQIQGDITQLTEAFSNLIDNSIKYTLKGEIEVKLHYKQHNTTQKTSLQTPVFKDVIVFSVKDTGVGILPEDKEKLFTEGGRGKNVQRVNVDSTGFGLYIVKNIIEAHNGKVWVESDGEGKGSEFVVELPVK